MTTTINLTGLQNSTTVIDMVLYANQVTHNLAGGLLITAVFFIMLVTLIRRGHEIQKVLTVRAYP